jgi:hypothetical protein
MSIPAIIKHTGIAVSQLSASGQFAEGPFETSFTATYAAHKSSELDVVGATLGSPLVIPLENVVKVRALLLRCTGNTVTLLLTSSAGTDQKINLSSGGLHVFHAPTVGDEFTAIKLVGNGSTVAYMIAGDLA